MWSLSEMFFDFGISLLFISAVALYFAPTIISLTRDHEYKWVILALNIAGGWTVILWIAALVWAVYPKHRSIVDPVAGNVTGLGNRNIGHTIGEISSAATGNINHVSPTANEEKYRLLERLGKLKESGTLNNEEFEAEKKRILSQS